jgi:hypothetical protein
MQQQQVSMMAPDTPPLLKQLMDTCVLIYREFVELKLPGRDEWLWERYAEVRKLVKVQLKELRQRSSEDWSDWLLTID